jgi:hypothetical protein
MRKRVKSTVPPRLRPLTRRNGHTAAKADAAAPGGIPGAAASRLNPVDAGRRQATR